MSTRSWHLEKRVVTKECNCFIGSSYEGVDILTTPVFDHPLLSPSIIIILDNLDKVYKPSQIQAKDKLFGNPWCIYSW